MAKSTKIIAALGVAGALGVAAMPLSSYAAHTNTETSIEDDITVEVASSCKFTTDHSASTSDESYSYTGAGSQLENGATAATEVGTHVFNVYCNDNEGYNVTATTTGLTAEGIGTIEFIKASAFDSAISKTGGEGGTYGSRYKSGAWTAVVTATTADGTDYILENGIGDNGKVVTKKSGTEEAGNSFSVTYKAYAGTETKAGTYTGTVTYTLAH